MSSFSLNTLLLFIALAPGFVGLSAFYVFGRLPRRAYGASPTIELGALATIALFAHLLFGGLFALVVAPLFFEPAVIADMVDLMLNQVSGRGAATLPAGTPPGSASGGGPGSAQFYAITGYAAFVCALVAFAGYLLVRAIETGVWVFCDLAETLTSGMYWDAFVRPAGRMGPIFVYVLTNTSHDGRLLMYSGVLENISMRGVNWIEYVVLSNASRFLMTIDQNTANTPDDSRHYIGLDDDAALRSRVIVPAENIANIAFRPMPVLVGAGEPRGWVFGRLFAALTGRQRG